MGGFAGSRANALRKLQGYADCSPENANEEMNLPETTIRLLRAVKNSRDFGRDNYRAKTVEISDAGIICYPVKSKFVSDEIARAGLSDAVSLFIYEKTRHRVENQFRHGLYDVTGNKIKVLR